jgi:hypothetical protein
LFRINQLLLLVLFSFRTFAWVLLLFLWDFCLSNHIDIPVLFGVKSVGVFMSKFLTKEGIMSYLYLAVCIRFSMSSPQSMSILPCNIQEHAI